MFKNFSIYIFKKRKVFSSLPERIKTMSPVIPSVPKSLSVACNHKNQIYCLNMSSDKAEDTSETQLINLSL